MLLNMKRIFIFFAGLLTVLAHADSLPIKPGLWESTMTSTNSMTGTQTKTSTQCMTEDEWNPQSMMEEVQGCTLTESSLSGNTLTFSMSCDIQGAESTVSGVYSTQGDTGEGTMNMEMSFGGQVMTMEATFVANRLGDC